MGSIGNFASVVDSPRYRTLAASSGTTHPAAGGFVLAGRIPRDALRILRKNVVVGQASAAPKLGFWGLDLLGVLFAEVRWINLTREHMIFRTLEKLWTGKWGQENESLYPFSCPPFSCPSPPVCQA